MVLRVDPLDAAALADLSTSMISLRQVFFRTIHSDGIRKSG